MLPALNGHVYTKTPLERVFPSPVCLFFFFSSFFLLNPCGAEGRARRNSECRSRPPEQTFVWVYVIMTTGDERFLGGVYTERPFSVVAGHTLRRSVGVNCKFAAFILWRNWTKKKGSRFG